jgi:hypothetical protein
MFSNTRIIGSKELLDSMIALLGEYKESITKLEDKISSLEKILKLEWIEETITLPHYKKLK